MGPESADNLGEWTVLIGRVSKPHGLDGEVSVIALTDRLERFANLEWVGVFPPRGRPWRAKVQAFRPVKGRAHLTLEGVDDRSAAESLRGAELRIRPDMRYELEEDEYWVDDLVGMAVLTDDGRPLGTVREVLSLPANDVYVTEYCLIPAIKDVLVSVDLELKTITVRPMPGLAPDLGI